MPQGQDRGQVKPIVDELCRHHQLRAAGIVLLTRATGMLLRAAILADLPRLSSDVNNLGRINIQDGTKGGRAGASVPHCIAVNANVHRALEFARYVSPPGRGVYDIRNDQAVIANDKKCMEEFEKGR